MNILQNEIIWIPNMNSDTKYYDLQTGKYIGIYNDSHSKYKTTFVERIRNGLLPDDTICSLIELCLVKRDYLKILYSRNKIPYSIINKELGEKAVIRLNMYLFSKTDMNTGKVPILFNNNPDEKINNEIDEYIRVEKIICKCF